MAKKTSKKTPKKTSVNYSREAYKRYREEGRVQLLVWLPGKLRERLKKKLAKEGVTLTEWVAAQAKAYV